MRGVALEMSYVEATVTVWQRAVAARKQQLQLTVQRMQQLREEVQLTARNATVQLVLPAGQVEILTTGHMADFEDASLVPRTDIEKINDLILVGTPWKLVLLHVPTTMRKVIGGIWAPPGLKIEAGDVHTKTSISQVIRCSAKSQSPTEYRYDVYAGLL